MRRRFWGGQEKVCDEKEVKMKEDGEGVRGMGHSDG